MSRSPKLPTPREAAIASAERWIKSGRIPGWAQEGLRNVALTSGSMGPVNSLALSFDVPEYDAERDPDVPRLEPAGSTSTSASTVTSDTAIERMLGISAGSIDRERKRVQASRTAASRRPVAGPSGAPRGKGAFRS